MHTPRRVLGLVAVTSAWVIFACVVAATNAAALIFLLLVPYVLGAIAFGAWRYSRSNTPFGIQRRLRTPGDRVRTRIGYLGVTWRTWDPSRPIGPKNGVRGAGFGQYELTDSGQVTLTWHPIGGQVQQFTGPPLALPPKAPRRRSNRVLIAMSILYLAILAITGLLAGLVSGSAVVGSLAVLIAMSVLPLIATALRCATTRANRREATPVT